MTVEVTPLSAGGAMFFGQLAAGTSLAAAAKAAGDGEIDFDLSKNLAVLLRSGAFIAMREGDTDENQDHA